MRFFISYRRSDTKSTAHRIGDALRKANHDVFIDDEDLKPGESFPIRIRDELKRSDCVFAVIGPKWEDDGRLLKESDFVRRELNLAVSYGVYVVPCLVDDRSVMPSRKDLPTRLQRLLQRQAIVLNVGSGFDRQIAVAIKDVSDTTKSGGPANTLLDQTIEVEQPKIRLLPVPGGRFTIGDETFRWAQPRHEVLISKFWMAETPTTNAQYRPYVQAGHAEPDFWQETGFNGDDQPVIGLRWEDAVAYCTWLQGRLRSEAKMRVGLPSEAQWEWVAKGRSAGPYSWSHRSNQEPNQDVAWFDKGVGCRPRTVGVLPRNAGPFGHLDLGGNVAEWCQDVWDPNAYTNRMRTLAGALPTNPVVERQDTMMRTVRGGSYWEPVNRLRVGYRCGAGRDRAFRILTFRACVVELEEDTMT